jgi:hypothetical protein
MTKIAITVLATITLAGPALSGGNDNPTDCGAKPNSYIPRHTNHHVYGAPIQTPIVGHARISHYKHAPKKKASSAPRPVIGGKQAS